MTSLMELLKNPLSDIAVRNTATWDVFKAYAFFILVLHGTRLVFRGGGHKISYNNFSYHCLGIGLNFPKVGLFLMLHCSLPHQRSRVWNRSRLCVSVLCACLSVSVLMTES